MGLTRVELENFTAFRSLKLDLCPGISVLVGANGTGKTHLMKVCYAACDDRAAGGPETGYATAMKYFAYGSNMLTRRLTARSRAPSAVARGVAAVSGFAVRFHKVGADGSGKCTLVETEEESAVAYGVLYELEDSDGDKLDRVRAGKRVCTRAATAGVPFSFVSSTAAPPML